MTSLRSAWVRGAPGFALVVFAAACVPVLAKPSETPSKPDAEAIPALAGALHPRIIDRVKSLIETDEQVRASIQPLTAKLAP